MGSQPARFSAPVQLSEDLELDVRAYELRSAGIPLKLKPIPFELLLFLVERRGELVTREQIVAIDECVRIKITQGVPTIAGHVRPFVDENSVRIYDPHIGDAAPETACHRADLTLGVQHDVRAVALIVEQLIDDDPDGLDHEDRASYFFVGFTGGRLWSGR